MFGMIYKMQQKKVRRKVLIFSLLSGFISTIATLFLTPKTGKEMREEAKVRFDDAKNKISEASVQVKDKASEVGTQVKDKATEFRGQAMNATRDVVAGIHEKMEQGKEEIKDKANEVKDKAEEVKHDGQNHAQKIANAAREEMRK